MKAVTILSLAAAAAAAPAVSLPRAEDTASTTPNKFGGMALRSASNIHFASVSASGLQFWLNKPTATYCPDGVVSCPPEDPSNPPQTTFVGGDNTVSLSVNVPGGQQVYVNPEGLLKFTQAHSASQDPGSSVTGFSIDEAGNLLFEGESWYACNSGEADDNTQAILAASKADGTEYAGGCQGFSFRTVQSSENTQLVWQYT